MKDIQDVPQLIKHKHRSECITVERLFVLDKMVATNNLGQQMDMVENMKGEVMVISSEHDGGKQLESLGGIAAILRYALS